MVHVGINGLGQKISKAHFCTPRHTWHESITRLEVVISSTFLISILTMALVHEEENVSYAVGEKDTPSLNLQNDSDFNAGVNEDDHLTPLERQRSTDKSVCTPSPNEEVGENHNFIIRHMGILVKDRTMCLVRVHSWNDIDESAKEHTWAVVKDKFNGKDFELDREGTLRRMKRLWHYWRPKDVRGPLPSRAALQAMLWEKEKENIALHRRMDDMENAHKNNMDKQEDQVRMLANLVMANQQTSGANPGSGQDDV
ncbi:hypothetical protein Cgig2_003820 [Carnegiea gigantea]|uniref:Uncharacterized protein n=1 Tax=Carnegiea gigantea TaxID=171969 RepID=A0A9Q1KNA6_9CARY|nr:hypothetical protein Cgig2_003820 [Carnegiea gigantea]